MKKKISDLHVNQDGYMFIIEFQQEDESREEVRENKKHKNHKGRDDR